MHFEKYLPVEYHWHYLKPNHHPLYPETFLPQGMISHILSAMRIGNRLAAQVPKM